MKKVFLFICFALISTGAFAQPSFSVKAGMNVSNFSGDDDAKARVGFKVGVGADFMLSDLFYLQPSLYFSTKGANYDMTVLNVSGDLKIKSMYIELPIMVGIKLPIGMNSLFNVGIGPYIACGVGGKAKLSGSLGNLADSSEFDTFGDDMGFDRFDAGLGLIVGAELGRFLVGADVQIGLTKLNPTLSNIELNDKIKNMSFSIGVGYKF